jgi:hypothetical protein
MELGEIVYLVVRFATIQFTLYKQRTPNDYITN